VFKHLANSVILPNVYRNSVKELKAPDGGRMLFFDYEYALAQQARAPPVVALTARYLKWFQAELARRISNLVVLMVACPLHRVRAPARSRRRQMDRLPE
jgi:hypothetical protein